MPVLHGESGLGVEVDGLRSAGVPSDVHGAPDEETGFREKPEEPGDRQRADKLDRQLKRHKEKLTDHHRAEGGIKTLNDGA